MRLASPFRIESIRSRAHSNMGDLVIKGPDSQSMGVLNRRQGTGFAIDGCPQSTAIDGCPQSTLNRRSIDGRHPTRWNEYRHVGPVDARFDHHKGAKPSKQARTVLYAAINPLTCLAEVFQKQRVIKRSHSDDWLVGFSMAVPILSRLRRQTISNGF